MTNDALGMFAGPLLTRALTSFTSSAGSSPSVGVESKLETCQAQEKSMSMF